MLDLAFVGGAPFKYLAKQKDVKLFAIFICDIDKRLESLQEIELAAVSANNINFQMNKTDKPPTDSKTKVPEEYHDFLDVFSKKALDTVAEHFKYDHRIRLLEKHKNLSHSPLRGMSQEQLKFIKKFLENNLKKGFIEASSLLYSSPILLAKKPGGNIRFCVDYQ